ncbi:MAG: ABC transporter ATP-binding protein [Bacteroidales bacterium]|nr:ABC transporter ATP-binding protein [Bacteroidales bacterium]
MLKIKEISKSYMQRGVVLNKLNLEIRRGSSVAITGPSGSGKTTLLNIIGLLTKADEGKVFFHDQEISHYSADDAAEYRNKKIGFIFQDHLLLSYLTVYENIMLPLMADKHAGKRSSEASDYALTLMEKTGISNLKNKFPAEISGGEAQRATLVRALINKPEIILADEPTGSLDAVNAEMLTQILVDLNKELGTTLVVVTHSEKLAKRMQKKMRIEKGILIETE